jgi:hypothetical protein
MANFSEYKRNSFNLVGDQNCTDNETRHVLAPPVPRLINSCYLTDLTGSGF